MPASLQASLRLTTSLYEHEAQLQRVRSRNKSPEEKGPFFLAFSRSHHLHYFVSGTVLVFHVLLVGIASSIAVLLYHHRRWHLLHAPYSANAAPFSVSQHLFHSCAVTGPRSVWYRASVAQSDD